jgi:hypothetical protein
MEELVVVLSVGGSSEKVIALGDGLNVVGVARNVGAMMMEGDY